MAERYGNHPAKAGKKGPSAAAAARNHDKMWAKSKANPANRGTNAAGQKTTVVSPKSVINAPINELVTHRVINAPVAGAVKHLSVVNAPLSEKISQAPKGGSGSGDDYKRDDQGRFA